MPVHIPKKWRRKKVQLPFWFHIWVILRSIRISLEGENIVELRILEELLEDKSATFLIMIGHLINDLFVWMRSFVALNVGEELSLSIFF